MPVSQVHLLGDCSSVYSIPLRSNLFGGQATSFLPDYLGIPTKLWMASFCLYCFQNVCNSFNDLDNTHSLELRAGQSYLLSPPSDGRRCACLIFKQGIARLAGSFGGEFPDITLGFCGFPQMDWIRLPSSSNFLLEALTDINLELSYIDKCPLENDITWQWLFDLHLVRHPVGAGYRLVSLFKLLVSRFGIKKGHYYVLPFALSHARIAELIGATRSTVTRQITELRNQKHVQLIDPDGSLLLSEVLIKSPHHCA